MSIASLVRGSAIALTVLAGAWGGGKPVFAQSGRTLSVNLYTPVVHWRATAGAMVTVQVVRAGTVVADGGGAAGSDGWATVSLVATSVPQVHPIRPRDLLRIGDADGVRDVVVPDLRVDMDAGADRVFGVAPAGGVVQLSIASPAGSSSQAEAAVGPDGTFEFSLGASFDVLPGDTGSVRIDEPGGYRFTVAFAVRRLDLTLWQPAAQVMDVPGAEYDLVVRPPGGAPEQAASLSVLSAKSRLQLVASGTLEAGTVITVTRRGPIGGVLSTTTLTVPRVTVNADPKGNRVSGYGPESADLAVQVTPRTRLRPAQPWTAKVTTDVRGAFFVPLPADVSLDDGAVVRVTYEARPEVLVSATTAMVATRAQLFGTRLDGILVPGAPLRAALRSPDGATKATASGITGEDGYFLADFGGTLYGTHFENILPGDTIELDWSWGDPVLVPVPAFTVQADVAGDRVFGTAPPGAEVTVTTAPSDAADELTLRGDIRQATSIDGQYTADFAGVSNIARRVTPGASDSNGGLVRVKTSAGNVFYTSWTSSPVDVTVGRDVSVVRGYAAPGREVGVTLLDPSGDLLVARSMRLNSPNGFPPGSSLGWSVELRNSLGQPVPVQAGDVVRVVAGDEVYALPVPEMTGTIDVRRDVVAGVTVADSAVEVTAVSGKTMHSMEIQTSHDGAYRADFSPVMDLRYGDAAWLRVPVADEHQIQRIVSAPGLTLDLDEQSLAGNLAPDAVVQVSVERDGRQVLTSDAIADWNGDFRVQLGSRTAPDTRLLTGDVIVVGLATEPDAAIHMPVPVFDLTMAVDGSQVQGRGEPGATLYLNAVPAYVNDRVGRLEAGTIELTGTATFASRWATAPQPGDGVIGTLWLASGHRVLHKLALPSVSAEVGGARVCGSGLAGNGVDVWLYDADNRLSASGKSTVAADGLFRALLDGAAITAGARLRAAIGGRSVEASIPRFSADVRWSTALSPSAWGAAGAPVTAVSGTAPPGATMYVTTPLDDCRTAGYMIATRRGEHFETERTSADFRGRFQAEVPERVAGEGVEIAFFDAAGNRFFRHLVRPQIRAFVYSPRIEVTAQAGLTVSLAVRSPAGATRAQLGVAVASDGRGVVSLRDQTGRDIRLDPGDTVTLASSLGDGEMTVEPLDFDVSPRTGIWGRALAARPIDLRLTLPDGQVIDLQRASGQDGRFSLDASDIPAGEGWSLADVRHVEVASRTRAGHETVAAAVVGAPTATPGPGGGRSIYLPCLRQTRIRR
jgi:hypothetical protein